MISWSSCIYRFGQTILETTPETSILDIPSNFPTAKDAETPSRIHAPEPIKINQSEFNKPNKTEGTGPAKPNPNQTLAPNHTELTKPNPIRRRLNFGGGDIKSNRHSSYISTDYRNSIQSNQSIRFPSPFISVNMGSYILILKRKL